MLQVSNTVFRVWVKKYIQETREIKVDEWQPEAMTFIASASRLHTLHMPPLSRNVFFFWAMSLIDGGCRFVEEKEKTEEGGIRVCIGRPYS